MTTKEKQHEEKHIILLPDKSEFDNSASDKEALAAVLGIRA
jgi:hypothetical protein